MSSPAAGIRPLLDAAIGEPLINDSDFYVVETAEPVKVLTASIPIRADNTRLHVTTDGVYWSGYTGDAHTYIETGFLDVSYLKRFIEGRLA
jgi:hypothetical protein